MAGAPTVTVDIAELTGLVQTGTSKTTIAKHFGISRPTLDRLLQDNDMLDNLNW